MSDFKDPTRDEVIEKIANGGFHQTDYTNKTQTPQITEQQKEDAKINFSPLAMYQKFPEDIRNVGPLINYIPKYDLEGNRVYEDKNGKKVPAFETDSNGQPAVANQVEWDSEIEYDIKRGIETYDKHANISDERETVNEESITTDPAMIKLYDLVMKEAIENNATDTMIAQYEHFGLVRFTDGDQWYNHRLLYKSSTDALITIIKRKAKLKISLTDTRLPQTKGKIVIGNSNFRIATGATQYGMFISLRQQTTSFTSLDSLDFPDAIKAEFRNAISGKEGLIAVGGPVGSGKTTLMTTGLVERAIETNGSLNIMSFEKPIETPTPGILQVEIDEDYGVTWSNALQAALREKPNILRIGEINEKTAADAVVRASNSGSVTLTTLHIRSALEVFETLRDYGISVNNIKNSLKLVVYMNRVPRLCPHCRRIGTIFDRKDLNKWAKYHLNDSKSGSLGKIAFRNPAGCEFCRKNQRNPELFGTKGKVGIYELLKVNKPMLRIWRKYSEYDTYVLRDKLLHPETITWDDPDNPERQMNDNIKGNGDDDMTGLTFFSLQRDVLAKLQSLDIDFETAKYLINE